MKKERTKEVKMKKRVERKKEKRDGNKEYEEIKTKRGRKDGA
jgi:hypothetical protein